MKNYRGFVFAKMNDVGPDFEEFFGESLSSIDNMVDRSPVGRLEVAGGVLRYMHNCNWKMLVENQTDTCHPMVAHEFSAGTAVEVWKKMSAGHAEADGGGDLRCPSCRPTKTSRRWASASGTTATAIPACTTRSIPTTRAVPGYFEKMVAAYGEERAKAILDENRHNTVYFPNFMIKGPIQAHPPVQADLRRTARWPNPGPSGWSMRPTCCWSAR